MEFIKNNDTIIKAIKNNEIVIMPTDTVYGIFALANEDNEIRINQFKNNDINKKISIIFKDTNELINNVDNISKKQLKMINKYLPGKYTFIINLNDAFIKKNEFSRKDFGVRVTNNLLLQSIINKTGPLLATSCNKASLKPCANKKEIEEMFTNDKIKVLFTTNLENSPSTIIDLINYPFKNIR